MHYIESEQSTQEKIITEFYSVTNQFIYLCWTMASNISPVILSALELEVHFGEQVILDKASLSVHDGDRIGLVGRNGAGKSTFLKIISGLLPADSGEVAKKKI